MSGQRTRSPRRCVKIVMHSNVCPENRRERAATQLRKRADAMAGHAAAHHRGRRRAARQRSARRARRISAVAERAGVQRQTVYRHFPTEDDLFAACSGHFVAAPPAGRTRARGARSPTRRSGSTRRPRRALRLLRAHRGDARERPARRGAGRRRRAPRSRRSAPSSTTPRACSPPAGARAGRRRAMIARRGAPRRRLPHLALARARRRRPPGAACRARPRRWSCAPPGATAGSGRREHARARLGDDVARAQLGAALRARQVAA